MAAKKDSFVINLRLRKSLSTGEVHDTILEELIRAGDEKVERDRVKVFDNGNSSIIRSLPFDARLIASVAFSPPFLGIVLNNGKACRYRVAHGDGKVNEKLLGIKKENDVGQSVSVANGKEGDKVENRKFGSTAFVDSPRTTGKDDMIIDIGLPDEGDYPLASKRQKTDKTEGETGADFSMQDFGSNPDYEESFEERRFTQLFQLGLEGGRNAEQNNQTGSGESREGLGELFPTVLVDNELSTLEVGGMNDSFVQGSTIPESIQSESSIPVPMVIEDRGGTEMPSEQFPTFIPASSIESGSLFPTVDIPPTENNTILPGTQMPNSIDTESLLLNNRQSRKRTITYPTGFRSMSDRLSFMQKPPTVRSSSPSSNTRKSSLLGTESNLLDPSEQTSSITNTQPISLEWIQSDCKDVQFESITALHSEFLLLTKDSKQLWTWPIPKSINLSTDEMARPYPSADFLQLKGEKIKLIDSDLVRVTIVTDSGKICSFFDPFISGLNSYHTPNLIKRLTLPATNFKELQDEEIMDVKSGNFYSVALTQSGKVFWWGLAPDHLKKMSKYKKQSQRYAHESMFEVGDLVALKERKEEMGSIIIKRHFINGPLIGRVVKIRDGDRGSDSHERKQYTVELLENGFDCKDGEPFDKKWNPLASRHTDAKRVEWSSDEVIFLEERACTVGSVVGLDGNYVVVSPHSQHNSIDKKLKVCFKSSLTKVCDLPDLQISGTSEFLVNKDRYSHAIRDAPSCVVEPHGSDQQYGRYRAVAISATKQGLAMLLNRLSDQRAFLVQPEGFQEDNSIVFTCNSKNHRTEKEILVSDSNITSEFESVCAKRCMLDVSIEKLKGPGGMEEVIDAPKGRVDKIVKAPQLISINMHDSLILLDRNSCLFPIRFGSCLLQSGTLQSLPFRILKLIEANYGDENRDEISVTFVAVHKPLALAPSILKNDKHAFDEAFQKIESCLVARSEENEVMGSSSCDDYNLAEEWLSEKYSGNRNILHICAGNISSSTNDGDDGFYMLRKILECKPIRNIVIKMLKEKDSLSCTPLLTAVWTNNSRVALALLSAVLIWEKSDPSLFSEAACCKSVTGMTLLHHLVFNTSGLQPNFILQNSLIVSNVPSNYSPRMLLQLFKERYASAYRACIPVPSEKWQVKSVIERVPSDGRSDAEASGTQVKSATTAPTYAPTHHVPPQPRVRIGLLNRADALRASAKQGLVMFSDVTEMNQALAEMDQYPLICKDESGPGGFTSVARYIIQVHRADDKNSNSTSSQARTEDISQSRPTRHIIHPALQASPLRLPGYHLLSDPFLSRSITYGRQGARVFLPRETVYSRTVNASQAKDVNVAVTQRQQTAACTKRVSYFKVLVRKLLTAHPEIALVLNDQEETALAYYFNSAKRLTDPWVYNLFGRWMVCNSNQCKVEYIFKKLDRDMITSGETKDDKESLERTMMNLPGNDLKLKIALPGVGSEAKSVVGISERDLSGTDLSAKSTESDIDIDLRDNMPELGTQEIEEIVGRFREQNRKDVDSLHSKPSSSNASKSCPDSAESSVNIGVAGEAMGMEVARKDSREPVSPETANPKYGLAEELAKDKSSDSDAGPSTGISESNLDPISWGPIVPPSRQFLSTSNDDPTLSIMDSAPPQGLLSISIQPAKADLSAIQNERTLADIERLASIGTYSKSQPLSADKSPVKNIGKTSSSKEFCNTDCVCVVSTAVFDQENIRRQFFVLLHLLHSQTSVLGSIYGRLYEGEPYVYHSHEGGSEQQESAERSSQISRICVEKLDLMIGNLLTNPAPFSTRFFVKTLLKMPSSTLKMHEVLRNYISCTLNPEVNFFNLTDRFDVEMGTIETAATYRRFLGSVVRQLSLCLSKESSVDPRFCYKIGRFAKVKVKSEDERTIESIRLTLRSFSWLSVIEILKAAETTIRPVRLGISKAQPRGIVSGIQSLGERPQPMHSLLGTNSRAPGSNRRTLDSSRFTSHIKVASRRPSDQYPMLCPTKLIMSDTVEEEANLQTRDSFDATSASRDSGHMASNLQRQQGTMSPLAWTLDGHIRVSDMPRGRSLPIPDFLDKGPDPDTVPSIHAGNCYLAQIFCRLVKEAVDLAHDLTENGAESKYCPNFNVLTTIDVPHSSAKELMDYAKNVLSKTWVWLTEVMNSIETQLKTGEEFDTQRFATRSLRLDPTISEVPSLGRPPNFSQSYVSKPEEYLMYLLKAANGDSTNEVFPILDLMSYSHVTFVLDAYFYMLKKWPYGQQGQCEAENHQTPRAYVESQIDKFFGQSMTSLSADRFEENKHRVLRIARMPYVWLAPQSQDASQNSNDTEVEAGIRGGFKSSWKATISAFAKLFLAEPPGMERECFLAEHAGSAGRIARFQRALAQLKEDCLPKNITEESRPFTASIRRQRFLTDSLKYLMPTSQVDNHPYSSLNIRFEGEEGTGPGVNRGFFTGFANALTGDGGTKHAPFFHQPGQLPEQAGIFSTKRISRQSREDCYKYVFTAVGRFLGLVLWFNQAVPITFTRPILKFLLNREDEITFEDLAYHNSTLYSSYCQMILDANSPSVSEEEFQDIYCSDFQVTIDQTVHELVPGGSKIRVTKDNVSEMVRLASLHIMIEHARSDLEYLRSGLHQIIPKKLLQPLSAEDFQLLLSGGIGDIDLSRLRNIIRFNNARNCSRESIERFKGWFWSIVRDMTPVQRMKLLYFLTGSAVLPAYDNKIGNNEELAVTVDIVGQSSTSLPVASTCGQRLSMPLYESRKELRKKLLIAIECETYNLG